MEDFEYRATSKVLAERDAEIARLRQVLEWCLLLGDNLRGCSFRDEMRQRRLLIIRNDQEGLVWRPLTQVKAP